MRCVLPHTQRCHESKACTSPATALYFSSKQTATATAGGWRASVEQVGTGGEGRRRGGGSNSHSAPLSSLPACATPLAGDPPHSTPPPPPPPTETPQTASGHKRCKAEKGRAAVRSILHSHSAPPVSARLCATTVRCPGCRSGLAHRCTIVVAVSVWPENIFVYV